MTRLRVWAVVGYAIIAAAWISAVKAGGSFIEVPAGTIAFFFLGIVVGAFVRRLWMLLALAGPTLVLAYLEMTGFVGGGDWAREPLLSPPGIGILVLIGIALLLGRAIGEGVEWIQDARRGHVASSRPRTPDR